MKTLFRLAALLLTWISVTPMLAADKPTLYLIGDSTVKNGTAGQQGWGERLGEFFDPEKIQVVNRALGGRSSRTYLREGLWDAVLKGIKKGDFVMMQFGHNDGGPIDEGKARASLKGNGEETKDVTLKDTGAAETVHTYGWYLRRYITDAKASGATVIVCSPIPRNMWKEGKVLRAGEDYGKWAKEAAAQTGALFLDLNEIIARHYDEIGEAKVMERFFKPADHTHTVPDGALFNARCVVEGLKALPGAPVDALKSELPQ